MWIMEQAEASLATSKQDYSSEDSVKTTIKEEDKDILSKYDNDHLQICIQG